MTVHLMKLCVGVDSLARLKDLVSKRHRDGLQVHTRNKPKRIDEVLDGGSLYWVIGGQIVARQPVIGFETQDFDDRPMHYMHVAPKVIEVQPTPKRAFQGWRYLEGKDAPKDLANTVEGDLPEHIRDELIKAGAW